MPRLMMRNIPERDFAEPQQEAQQAQRCRRMARTIRKPRPPARRGLKEVSCELRDVGVNP